MRIDFIGIESLIPEEEKLDCQGNYLSHPLLSQEVLAVFKLRAISIQRVIFIGTSWSGVDKKRLVKIADRLTIDHNIVTLEGLDTSNKRLMEHLKNQSGWGNELNLLFQSDDHELLREVFHLFPEPYRRRIAASEKDLSDRALPALEDIRRILTQMDEKSFLISSANESCLFCIFAHEPVRELILSWS